MNLFRHPRTAAVLPLLLGLLGPAITSATPDAALPPAASKAGLSTTDWRSITDGISAHRHRVQRTDAGLSAVNPGQGWRIGFDEQGFLVTPASGDWRWGLRLAGWGRGEATPLVGTATPRADGYRVEYPHDARITEWLINDRRGLEHGFTVAAAPVPAAVGDAPLVLTLAVRGALRPQTRADGLGIDFLGADGTLVLDYTGLLVTDADGRRLPARLAAAGEALVRLEVDDAAARYPLTIDPLAQQAYLKASNTGAGDYFGRAVSVSGDTLVVGALSEDSNAVGIDGNGADNSAPDSGAAYVFVRDPASGTWTQQAYLKASNTGAGDWFGLAVALSGNTLVVGALAEDSAATGVDGNQADNSATDAGAAYVFVRDPATGAWTQQAYLKAFNTGSNDQFGWHVAISGDTLVVGAPGESSDATGINGDGFNDRAPSAGAAYVFVRNPATGTWSQQAYLKTAYYSQWYGQFGVSVAISGDTVLVGAPGEYSGGAAYVFARHPTDGTWSQQQLREVANTGDQFGAAVSISGDIAVVGAPGDDSGATGVNNDPSFNFGATDSGAAYLFVRDPASGEWWLRHYLKASNTGAGDAFGHSVSVAGNTVVVGAPLEDSAAVGVDGDQSDNSASNAGAVYLFARDPFFDSGWFPLAYLKASNTDPGDFFGIDVSLSDDTLVVGAATEDSSATGVEGDQSDNGATDAGAAYVFTGVELPPSRVWITATMARQTLTRGDVFMTDFVYTSLAHAGGVIQGFDRGYDAVDLAAVLTEQGYAGTDPLSDGTVSLLNRRGQCYVLVDPDGSAGPRRAVTLTVLANVPCTDLYAPFHLILDDD